jgi:hypothetical protein
VLAIEQVNQVQVEGRQGGELRWHVVHLDVGLLLLSAFLFAVVGLRKEAMQRKINQGNFYLQLSLGQEVCPPT